MYKRLYNIGIVAYVIMLILSILFYKERTIILDSAYDLFHILRGAVDFNAVRFAGVLPKLGAVFAVKMGLSLSDVLLSYSVVTAVYYFVLYIICGSLLKKYEFALAILLCNTIFVSECFYYVSSELPQGIAFLLFTIAFISANKDKGIFSWILILVFVVAIAFFHPLMVFVLAYAVGFLLLRKEIDIDRRVLYSMAILFFVLVVFKTLVIRTQYEQHSMGGLKNFITQFPNYFTLYSDKQFLHNCVTRYYWIPLISAGVIWVNIVNRDWKKLLFFTGSLIGYLLLVNISYPTIVTPTFYIENLYLPVGLFLALPFVFDLLPVLISKQIAMPVVAIILFTGCVRMYMTHSLFTARLDFERTIIKEYGGKKVILDANKVNAGIIQMLWGTPYEFLLLSICEGQQPASIIIDDKPAHRPWVVAQKKSLVVNYNIFPYDQLSPKYFHFIDTTSGYIIDPATPGR